MKKLLMFFAAALTISVYAAQPTTAPVAPTQDAKDVKALFCSAYSDQAFSPNGWGTTWQTINVQGTSMFYTESMGWDCFTNWGSEEYDFSGYSHFCIDLYATAAGHVDITFESSQNLDPKVNRTVNFVEGWNKIDLDVKDCYPGVTFQHIKYLALEAFSNEGSEFAVANAYFYGPSAPAEDEIIVTYEGVKTNYSLAEEPSIKYDTVGGAQNAKLYLKDSTEVVKTMDMKQHKNVAVAFNTTGDTLYNNIVELYMNGAKVAKYLDTEVDSIVIEAEAEPAYLAFVGKQYKDDAFAVSREGEEIVLKYKTNTTPSFEGLPAWATVQGESTSNDTVSVTIAVAPNTTSAVRNAVVRVFHADVEGDILYYITQDCTLPSGANVLFADNFDWMKAYYEDYANANSGRMFGDAVGKRDKDSNSPNFYSASGLDNLRAKFAELGYSDKQPSRKIMYPQDGYFKFGKTSNGTRLVLPALNVTGTVDATITFNYAFHLLSSGAIDATELYVFVDGVKVNAEALPTTQVGGDASADPRVLRDITWQTATLNLTGISSTSVIEIGNESFTTTGRFYLDNIVIEAEVNAPAPETIEWGFNSTAMQSYADHFGGTAGAFSRAAGNGNMYVESNVSGNGKIEYYQIDKTTIDTNDKASRIVSSTGQPYVTGTWVGDYWLTSADLDTIHPAGTKVSFHALSRCSGTGMRYWLMEYKDGNEWKPLLTTTTENIETGENVTYNIKHDNTTEFPINVVVTLTQPTKRVEFRQTCVANAQASGKGALTAPNGGTHRYQGSLASDGSTNTSTKIIVGVVEE